MPIETRPRPADDEIRFLEYRLEVVRQWPTSTRKKVTLEALSRRLAALATVGVACGASHDDLVALSCRLLDGVFLAGVPAAAEEQDLLRVL